MLLRVLVLMCCVHLYLNVLRPYVLLCVLVLVECDLMCYVYVYLSSCVT